ncbi:cytochrome P450 [Xylaria venustula]|nr:cytochrome P450 [Xylaria venustula]
MVISSTHCMPDRAYEKGITNLFLLPQCFSPKATRNRKFVADAFQQYFQHGHHEYASGLIKNFYATECAYGYSLSDRARFEVGNAMGILENTYSAVFWVVFHVFSNPGVLLRVREEVADMVTTTITTTDSKQRCRHELDMTKLKSHCPFLVSTFKETMRLHSAGVSIREVCRETVLDHTYRLRKGALVIMPTIAVHTDPDVWGLDALSFNYERFLPEKSNKSNSSTPKEKVSPAAFRTFGGGTTLCPGRHLATAQIMVWISMLVMRFDLEPVSGCWERPGDGQSNMANVIMRPDRDDEVRFNPREYFNDGIWDVRFDGEVATLNLTVDDSVDG